MRNLPAAPFLAEWAEGFYTTDLMIILLMIIGTDLLVVAAALVLAGRIRELREEVLAAELARDDLDRRTLGDPCQGRHRRDGESQ